MVEKIKKGPRNRCVTALLLLLFTGITHTQEQPQGTIVVNEQENIFPDDPENVVEQNEQIEPEEDATQSLDTAPRRINNIIISGNKFTSDSAIINHIPYKIGESFDPNELDPLKPFSSTCREELMRIAGSF